MYKTELIEDITAENVTEKIDEKIKEMEKKSLKCTPCQGQLNKKVYF